MKPLDSGEGAADGEGFDAEHGAAARMMAEPSGDELGAGSEPLPAATPHRVSQVVPRGTAEDEAAVEEREPPRHSDVAPRPAAAHPAAAHPAASVGQVAASEADGAARAGAAEGEPVAPAPALEATPTAPRYAIRELRPASADGLGATLLGMAGSVAEEEDETTMVDAGGALSQAERLSMTRTPSTMAETLPVGTPAPAAARLVVPDATPRADGRHPFKQTMLLGLPRLDPQASVRPAGGAPPRPALLGVSIPPAGSAAPRATSAAPGAPPPGTLLAPAPSPGSVADAEKAAVLASVVRVVGPPTHPPPRRSRRGGGAGGVETTIGGVAAPEADEPDHEAFVLSNPVAGVERGRRSSAPSAPPAEAASPSSLSGLMLPRPARPWREERSSTAVPALAFEGASARALPAFAGAAPERVSYPPPLRATIEPPAALSRTRPPRARVSLPPQPELPLDGLPGVDPFTGFAAPAPSVAQRWLVVVVVALAVVGLCSLAAIAFGFLGKTGW